MRRGGRDGGEFVQPAADLHVPCGDAAWRIWLSRLRLVAARKSCCGAGSFSIASRTPNPPESRRQTPAMIVALTLPLLAPTFSDPTQVLSCSAA